MSFPQESIEEVFLNAVEEFKAGLNEEAPAFFQLCNSPGDMMQSLQGVINSFKIRNRSRLGRGIKAVASFSSKIEPFFDIIGIFISSNPDIAAIVWGAIRLIFKLSSNYLSFFERLVDMFRKFAGELPDYVDQVELIRQRAKKTEWRPSHLRLMKSLSQVYIDMLQFCLEATRIFSRKGNGVWKGASVIFALSWTPFHHRFRDILDRLRENKTVFNLCVASVVNEETLRHYDKVDEERLANSEERNMQVKDREILEKIESDMIARTMLNIRRWVAAPDWTSSFESALKSRADDTGNWFLESPTYLEWREGQSYNSHGFVQENDSDSQVLILSGKPGYGKTILSATIIEDLISYIDQELDDPALGLLPGFVAYFYFEQRTVSNTFSNTAFRSVLAQILRTHQHTKAIVDVSSLAMMYSGSGQTYASNQDIISVLRLCIDKLGTSYMVFDGIDECQDWETFVMTIHDLTKHTSCRVIFLTRPHIPVLEICGSDSHHVSLESLGGNLEDIMLYLEPHANILASKIAGNLSPNEIVDAISNRSNSMFLWARLLVSYLKSPSMTPHERFDSIRNLNLLEGLDALYQRILETIQRTLPRDQWAKVHIIFQLIAVAKNPLRTWEIQTALAVQKTRHATADDIIPEFESVLIQICGSLVEIKPDSTTHFIHLSVLEYLLQASNLINQLPETDVGVFRVKINAANGFLAQTCLRYLANDIPHQPLSGSASQRPNAQTTGSKFPFLKYAAEFWPWHLLEYVQNPGRNWEEPLLVLMEVLDRAISNTLLTTTWIEALFVFKRIPNLVEVSSQIIKLSGPLREKARVIAAKMQRLSSCLSVLSKEWRKVLLRDPNEIWLPSINGFMNNEFLAHNEGINIRSLGSKQNDGSVLIASTSSTNGKEIATVRVWPGRLQATVEATEEEQNNKWTAEDATAESLTEWKVCYEILELESRRNIKVDFFVSADQIPADFQPMNSSTHFSFPIAFSPSLRTAMILGRVLEIRYSEEVEPPFISTIQPLFNSTYRWQQSPWNYLLLLNPYIPRRFNMHELDSMDDLPSIDDLDENRELQIQIFHTDYDMFHCQFSSDERYLIVQESLLEQRSSEQPFVINVYENSSWGRSTTAAFKLVASVGVDTGGEMRDAVAVHPHEPLIAIGGRGKVVIWKYTERNLELHDAHPSALNMVSITQCGNYLHGIAASSPVLVDIRKFLSSPTKQVQHNSSEWGSVPEEIQEYKSQSRLRGKTPTIETPGTAMVSTFEGQHQISMVDKSRLGDTITRRTIRHDGNIVTEDLLRLPKELSTPSIQPSILPSTDSNMIKTILHKAARPSYHKTDHEPCDAVLPILVDRQESSIPTRHLLAENVSLDWELKTLPSRGGEPPLAEMDEAFVEHWEKQLKSINRGG